jgi:hypothetical protein
MARVIEYLEQNEEWLGDENVNLPHLIPNSVKVARSAALSYTLKLAV